MAREFDEFKKEVETLFDEKYVKFQLNLKINKILFRIQMLPMRQRLKMLVKFLIKVKNFIFKDFICPKIKETFLAMQTEERNQQKWYELIDFEVVFKI